MASDTTLKTTTEKLEQEYEGKRGAKRPDLFLARGPRDHYLLVEFKRPSHSIDWEDQTQAREYRGELRNHIPNGEIDIVVVGGKVDAPLREEDLSREDLRITTYRELLSEAERELQWLIDKGNQG